MIITKQINHLIPIYKSGGVFAYPTESVFGLGCNPDNEEAVMRLLAIKNRPASKGLILIASDFSQVEKYLEPLATPQKKLTQASQTTYIFPAKQSTPRWLRGNFDGLAIRVTKHPLAKELCDALGSALVSTSANISGLEPAMTVDEVSLQLGSKIDAILDGELGNLSKPSEIRDSISGEKIR